MMDGGNGFGRELGKQERLLIGEVGMVDELSWELGRVERRQIGCLDVPKVKCEDWIL